MLKLLPGQILMLCYRSLTVRKNPRLLSLSVGICQRDVGIILGLFDQAIGPSCG